MIRSDTRLKDELRPLKITPKYYSHVAGSCLIEAGNTKIICTANIEDKVPFFLKGAGKGWLTAEYGMLPNSCATRIDREAVKGKQSARTSEIQRLLGRSLRAALDLTVLGEKQIKIDCDVLQADGGTRTAAISGGYVALALAINHWINKGKLKRNPLFNQVAAVSCGVLAKNVLLDLNYCEDSKVQTDANFVFTASGDLVEVQATSEGNPFTEEEFLKMMALAKKGVSEIIIEQNRAIAEVSV